MEFIEMLKSDEKFLYVLLTLTQEQVLRSLRRFAAEVMPAFPRN